MRICPNLSDPIVKERWESMVNDPALGRIEAMREVLEAEKQNRPIGTLSEVKEKLEKRYTAKSEMAEQARIDKQTATILEHSNDPVFTDPDTMMGAAILLNPINSKNLSVDNNSQTRAMEIVSKLAAQTGVPFAFVTPEEAVALTANSKNPYNITKGPGFVHEDTVYFIAGALTTELAFHEFSHPIIKTIQMDNPALFDKLFNQAITEDPNLLNEAYEEYSDLNDSIQAETDPAVKAQLEVKYKNKVAEEVLVKVLTKATKLKESQTPVSKGFAKVIKDLLYALKQAFRKAFGQKINISKLDSDTTMNQLADMLLGGKNFDIDTEQVSDADVTSFYHATSEYIEDLKNINSKMGNKFISTMTARIYEGASQQVNMILKNKNYSEMVHIFADEYNRGDLQEIRSNLSKYAAELTNKTEELAEDIERTRNEIQALVNSMLRLESMMEKMNEHVNVLNESEETQDTAHKAYYYSHVLGYWQKYITEAIDMLNKSKVDSKSPIMTLVNSIKTTMDRSAITLTEMSHRGVSEVLWEQWSGMSERAQDLFDEQIKTLKSKKASQAGIDNRYKDFYGMSESQYNKFKDLDARHKAGEILSYDESKEYEGLKSLSYNGINMTKEKLDRALKGQGQDANWSNSYLEGYLYNTDPVIGGFAMYFKNNMTDMETRVQERYNDIVSELSPLLKGTSFAKIGDLGKKIGFIDTFGSRDSKTGELIKKEVWTLLNPYKDYRYQVDKFNDEIKKLEERYIKTGSVEDRAALVKVVAEKAAHNRQYFYQEYVDDYYKLETMLSDEANYRRKDIFNRMNDIMHPLTKEYDILKTEEQMDLLWKEYRLLYSLYYPNGEMKTDSFVDDAGNTIVTNDLSIAQNLQEHREAARNFYEFKERPGVFQNALKNFETETTQKLIEQDYKEGSDEFNDMFETYRKAWIDRNTRTVIKPEFYAKRSKILDQIKEITGKLPANQANAIDFSEHWKKILDIVSGFRDDDGQPKGTEMSDGRKTQVKEAQQAMEDARDAWAGFSGLTTIEMKELTDLVDSKKRNNGLSPKDFKRYRELLELQEVSGLDKADRAMLNGLFAELKELQRKEPTEYYLEALNYQLDKIDTDFLYKKDAVTEITAENLESILTESNLKKLFSLSPEFKIWFEKNHVKKMVYNKELEKKVPVYERLYIWNVIKPNNEDYYEKTIINQNNVFEFNDLKQGVKVLMKDGTVNTIINNNGTNITFKGGKFISKTEINNQIKGIVETTDGLPTMKYFARVVKKEFRTGYDANIKNEDGTYGAVRPIIGVHKDNRGQWLPKNVQGSPYINDEYFKLKNADPNSEDGKLFKILEKITEVHLKNQEGINKKGKLYLDFPRYEKSNLEVAQTGGVGKKIKEKGNLFQLLFKRFIDWFKGAAADQGGDVNWSDNKMLVRADSFNDEIESIPIEGLFNLDTNETSTNIVESMFRYMAAVENHKQLVKMNPIARGIKNVLNDPNNFIEEVDKINRANFINRNIIDPIRKNVSKDKYVRRDAFNNFYNRDFLAQTQAGPWKDVAWVHNLQKTLFKRSSLAFFALNIPSALKNTLGAKFQAMLHTVGGSDVNVQSLAQGELWSAKYMNKLSFGDAYAKGHKSLEHQMGEIFDPIVGRFHEKFGQSITRTMGKDIASMSWLTNFRKWTEIQASMQTFAGMMYKKKIKMGNTEISYIDAFELGQDGKIKLKAGIDLEYGPSITYKLAAGETIEDVATKYGVSVEKLLANSKLKNADNLKAGQEIIVSTGKQFKEFKNRIHVVMNKLNGAYGKFEQPEMQRYLLFRFVSFLRRFFTTMALNRFGKERWNPGYGQVDAGYYVQGMKAFYNMCRRRNIHEMTPQDKKAFMKTVIELGALYMLGAMVTMLWGWDDDDPDRYEKLRKMSGHLPFPGTSDNRPGEEFNVAGFLSLHAMNQILQVRSENEQFIPWPGFGLDNATAMLDVKSLAFGPTLGAYGDIGADMLHIWEGSDKQYYQRKSGPYAWQEEGGSKLWTHVGKMFGLTGGSIDPALAITSFKKNQARLKN